MILFVVFDFDGVFTNGDVIFDNNNNIIKKYNIKDGKGLSLLKKNNIKIGLLSNFNTNKKLIFNNTSYNNFLNHFDFDKYYIGSGNKKKILDSWLKELNLNYNNVAYIGDDINDIEVLKLVNFSGCPNDAIDIVKNNVKYICNKKGGKGCVREFCERIIDKKNTILDNIINDTMYILHNYKLDNIILLKQKIEKTKKNIYFIGVGKSGNMAKHICDLLKCLSINAFYLDFNNLLHGDIGNISNNIIIMFSNSGNTKELINIIPYFKKRKCYLVGIYNNNGLLTKYMDFNVILPFKNEIIGNINIIPTNSCLSQLLFGNILVSLLKNNITIDTYANNHPAGNIGKKLLKIKDVIIKNFPKIILNDKIELNKILLEMTKYKIGCCFFVNNMDQLLGIMTDGDIRRLILKNNDIKYITIKDINSNHYYETNLNKYIKKCKKYNYIPILDNNIIIGLIQK